MRYTEYTPSQDLSPFIQCFWVMDGGEDIIEKSELIVPGIDMGLVFHLKDTVWRIKANGEAEKAPRSFLLGFLTNYHFMKCRGKLKIFGARFHPYSFHYFVDYSVHHFNNSLISLDNIWGKPGLELEEKIIESSYNIAETILIMENFLRDILKDRRQRGADKVTHSAVQSILKTQEETDVYELAQKMDISTRYLHQCFSDHVGVNPKLFSKLVRFHNSVKLVEQKRKESLTSVAYECGYFDQSHFIRDFKRFSGITPGKFINTKYEMARLLHQPANSSFKYFEKH